MNPEITSRGGASKQVGAAARNFSRNNAGKVGAVLTALLAVILAVSLAMPAGVAYAADPISDVDTSKDYTWSLGESTSTQYNGRVWTDKSVSTSDVTFSGSGNTITVPIGTDEDKSDFLVTYSALATSQQVSGKSNVPVDVVFVVDLSGSMSNSDSGMDDGRSRIAHVVDALNTSIETLMAANPDSRVAVVGYEETATTLLPLDHYTKHTNYWGNEQPYFSLNRTEPSDRNVTLTVNAVGSNNNDVNSAVNVSGGTNVQAGVYEGMNILASESSTTVELGGTEVSRVPSVVLMSDGAATFSSDSQSWWAPSNNGNDGPGGKSYYGNGMKAMMTASYMKQAINRNYGVEDTSSNYAAQVYTIGIGTSDLDDADDRNLANITLNPKDHWNDNNNMANAIRDAWNGVESSSPWGDDQVGYISNNGTGTPLINVGRQNVFGSYFDDWYTLTHPQQNDIVEVGLQYNDAYYDAITSEDISTIFADIVSSISINTPQVPTKVEGNDPVHDGYITYTDYIGDYMEVDSVKELIWAGKEFKNPQVTGEGTDDVTYTFSGEINNPAYENAQNANQIQITVQTETAQDGTKSQTMTVKIPASAIPLRVNTIELGENDQGETVVESNNSNNAYPLRLVYGVSLQEDINPDTLEGVSDKYIDDNTEDGKVNFYSNKYSGNTQGEDGAVKTVGDAKVEFAPADDNPFYFLQEDTFIYTSQTGDQRVTQGNFNQNATYWVPVTYYDGMEIVNTRVERAASTMTGYIYYKQDEDAGPGASRYAYIEKGAPRLGNLTDVVRDKSNNTTGTAETSLYPTFEGTDVHNGKFVVYLGNNGKLQLDAPASLIISKNVTADEGLTAPDANFTFEVTSKAKANTEVSAVITTGSGQSATTQDTTVEFNEDGVARVTLKANQSIELKGMSGADYSIKEINLAGGFDLTEVTGADQTAGEGNDKVASGTIAAGSQDERVTFTNNYHVSATTSETLGIDLSGTKTIDGRDFQEGDSFTFTIAAGELTPEAPLPSDTQGEDSVTITPESGDSATFEFDPITFTEPGEYCYIIRETDPTAGGTTPEEGLGGVDYDTAVFRISVVIVDNGDGTLRLATTDEIASMETEVENYTSNPMLMELVGAGVTGADQLQFDNSYNSESTTATIQGIKTLNVTNSEYRLQDGDFTFQIEALGSNIDGSDNFSADPNQPMPVDQDGAGITQTTNVANGNVLFDFAEDAFTQDMVGKTFGYKITEVNPSPDGSIMQNGVTYDTTEKIVKIEVTDDGKGNVIAAVTPNNPTENNPVVNFAFTNSYEPESITTTPEADNLIAVKKTFTGLNWGNGFTFKLEAVSNTAGIEVANMPLPSDADGITIGAHVNESGVRTGNFNSMTFTKEGEYTYKVTEVLPNGVTSENNEANGITYDTHTAQVTVIVDEDATTGKLSASVEYDNTSAITSDDENYEGAAAFTNTYEAAFDDSTAVTLNGTKNLTVNGNSNRTLGSGQFYAVVTALDGAPLGDAQIRPGATTYNVPNTADDTAENGVFTGSFEKLLNNLTFEYADLDGAASKDFVYLISEQQGNATGMTYDKAVYQITVTVTDDGNGKLSAGDPVIVKGTIQDGQFVADESQEGVNGVVFNNSYTPVQSDAVATTVLKKVLSGDREQPLQAGEFEFKIELSEGDASGVTLPDPATVTNDGDGNINFGNITFTKVGTYKIKATEIVPEDATENEDGTYTLNHVTYDTHMVETTFTVTDQNGKLTVNRAGTTGSTTFTNTYEPDETTTTDDISVDINILVTKEVTGAPATERFTFSLNLAEGQDGSSVFEGTGDNKTAFDGVEVTTSDEIAAGATETKAFAGVTFTKAGDYKFVIDETTTTDKQGWTYDDKTVEITVHVEDQDGKLAITGVDNNNPTFTNKYVPSGVTVGDDEAGLQATKQVTGAPATEEFEFALTLTSNNAANVQGLGENNSIVKSTTGLTGKENETEKIDFGELTFTAEGIYTFKVTENTTTDADGWTYGSGSGAVITVTVTDEGYDGQLDATTMVEVEGEQVDTNNPTIVNSYKSGSVTVGEASGPIQVTKNIEGTAPAAEDFNFTLTFTPDVDGNTGKAENIQGLTNNALTTSVSKESLVDDNTETVSFGKLTFTEEGDYYFTVAETNQAAENSGWTYDNTGKTVIVHVTDTDHDGYLEATVDDDAAVVTNKYKADSITIGEGTQAGIQVQKTLAGRDWQDKDSFEFILEAVDNAPMPADDGNKVTITNESENKNAAFGSITYDTAGEYKYTIKETTGSINGVTYDTHTANVTVTITDEDYDGALELKSIVYDNNTEGAADADKALTNIAAFTNTYDAASTGDKVPAGFALTKEFIGHEWTADYAFEFIMSPVSGKLADDTEVAVADIPMPKADDNAGVTVGEDGNAHKTVSGPQEGTTANFDFGTITYDKAGTYVYQVKEAKAGDTDKGVTYSNSTATITVTVTDKDASGVSTGKLVATASIEGDTFTNTYEANADYDADGAGGLDITKQLNNRNMTADQFTFTIEATGDNAADAAKKLGITGGATTTVKNAAGNAGEAVSVVGNPFETMSFDETDNGVTYTYTIKEEGKSGEGDYAGYTLDGTTYNVSIKATDKGDGTMTVTTDVNGTEYTDTRATAAFVNTYDAGDVTVGAQGDAQIVAHKTLKNDDIANYDGAFKFQVTSGNVVVAKGTNDANGNITFGDITYTTENLAAAATAEGSDTVGKASLDTRGEADVYTFNYSVSEIKTSLPGGVTYGDGDTNVTVKVTDDRHGELSVEVSYTGDATSVEFVNTYGAGEDGTAELNLKGNKEIVPGEGLTEAPALVDDTYTFEITGKAASDGTPAPMPEKTTATNKSGAVEFGPITFTMENVFGGTASTNTDESEATQETETVEEATTTEETEVTEGAESEESTTEESADSATAENGEESVVDESATDESSTEEASGDEATADESSKSAKSEKTAAAGVTSSDEGVSTQTAGRTKTFTYTIKETDGSVPGVDNDTTVKTVTVTVTDEGNGKISVSKKEADGADKGNDFTFINVYNVDPKESSLTGDGGFTITKTLTGRDMAQGEFSFRLQSVDDDSDFWTAPTNPAAADGEAAEITFGDMTFEKPGTYTYTLEEEQGKLGGVEYDTNKYTVIATVTDKDADGNYTGELEVTWQINGAADNTVAFKNTYTAQPATVSLGAGKLMKGRDLSAGEYTFKLSDTNGNEVSTAANEENGAVTFDTITYDQAGEYTYTIIEVTPEDTDPNTEGIQNNGVTYDQTVYNATVKVTDNAKGQLVPTISYGTEDGGAPVFTNTYTAPAEPEQGGEGDGDGGLFGMAKTGDFTGGIMAALAAVVAAAAAGATYAIRKMRRPRGRHAR